MLLLSTATGIVQFTKTDEFMPRFTRISEGQLKNTGGTTSAKKGGKQQQNQKNVAPWFLISLKPLNTYGGF